jgi:2',3'-cyclic-nucleotide 2'-phosphodiesterase (5'-nucleotidase family)
VYAVKVNGADIKSWLEAAAKRFNQIDVNKTTEQPLISSFRATTSTCSPPPMCSTRSM